LQSYFPYTTSHKVVWITSLITALLNVIACQEPNNYTVVVKRYPALSLLCVYMIVQGEGQFMAEDRQTIVRAETPVHR